MVGKRGDWRGPRKGGGAAEVENRNRKHCQGERHHTTTAKTRLVRPPMPEYLSLVSLSNSLLMFVFVLAMMGGTSINSSHGEEHETHAPKEPPPRLVASVLV